MKRRLLPVIESLQRAGVTSYRGIAEALNNWRIRTARGGKVAGVERAQSDRTCRSCD